MDRERSGRRFRVCGRCKNEFLLHSDGCGHYETSKLCPDCRGKNTPAETTPDVFAEMNRAERTFCQGMFPHAEIPLADPLAALED